MAAADAQRTAAALRMSLGVLLRRLRQTPAPGDVTLPQTAALARLERGGPATASALARLEQITPQSMAATLAGLEGRGLIERSADPGDGRLVLLAVTPAGRQVLRDRRDARTQRLAAALERDFSADERALLAAAAPLLERLAESL